jgi:hypothetical protein
MKTIAVICTLLLVAATLGVAADPAKVSSLVVGWSDEFNAMNWQPFPKPNAPDTSIRHKGFLKLSLGSGAADDLHDAAFYWASASRVVEVDVDRYPILAVRAVNLKGRSWWDVIIQGYDEKNGAANGSALDPVRPGSAARRYKAEGGVVGKEIKTPSLDHDGVILFDLQAQVKNGLELGSHKIRVRLNIAGQQKGVSVEYDWIRFVRRQDAEQLRANPHIRDIVVEP